MVEVQEEEEEARLNVGKERTVLTAACSLALSDPANFINFCSGKTLTNGLQIKTGSCNGVVMGEIPAQTNMVSTILLFPAHNDEITALQTFNISLRIAHLDPGHFTNATSTYYSAPQALNEAGDVVGHTHVTVQDLGNSLTPTQPLDASKFVFFKGINDAGDGKGLLQAVVTGGLPAGNYRVCTMSGASNHQPVLMPVAQRGTQEDCNKFTVKGGGNGGAATGGGAANGAAQGGNVDTASSTAAAAAAASSSAATGNGGGGKGGGKGGKGSGAGAGAGNAAVSKASTSCTPQSTVTVVEGGAQTKKAAGNGKVSAAAATTAPAAAATAAAAAAGGKAGASAATALGGIAAPAVEDSGDKTRPFKVNGNTFVNKSAAVQRACDVQNNACSNAVNSKKLAGVTVTDCGAQVAVCVKALS